MRIQYLNPGFDHSIDSIFLFQTEEETAYWSDALFYFYPQLDREHFTALPSCDRRDYAADVLRPVYDSLQPLWTEKLAAYNARWQQYEGQINAALSAAFGRDVTSLFNDLKCCITLNPVSPRFLQARYFDLFHLNSERGAIGVSIHEGIHYLWFHLWHEHFQDDPQGYERPDLKWILSEMVVESIMRDERLCSINPYFPRENGGCVYRYFQDMVIDGTPILDTLDALYRQRSSITAFMEEGYRYCQAHEPAIRAHIAEAEKAF